MTVRSPGRVTARRVAASLLGALALLVLSGCGGENGSIDATEGAEIAQASVVQLADLPGEGWVQEPGATAGLLDFSTFSPDGSDPTATEECRALTAAVQSVSQALEGTDPVAEASSGFQVGDETTLELGVVTSSVAVFPTVADAETASQAFATLVDADGLRSCFESVFDAAGTEGLEVKRLDAGTAEVTAEGAKAVRVELEAVALIFPINLTIEVHSFQRDHTLAVLLALSLNSEALSGDAPGAIAEAFATRAEAAQE